MPVVGVGRDLLFDALGARFTDEEFEDLCFEYGIELDDVPAEAEILSQTTERQRAQNMQNPGPEGARGEDSAANARPEEIIYRIDIPANRYDMLCLEGISRALNIFRRKQGPVNYRLADMSGRQPVRMHVRPETVLVRPFVVCAILRGVRLDKARYKSFIDLQDKLHQNLCRQRSLVAIGTHDLSKIKGPFTYEALPPGDIKFVPLGKDAPMTAAELMEDILPLQGVKASGQPKPGSAAFPATKQKGPELAAKPSEQAASEKDLRHLRRFVPIIRDSLVYPVIYDANRTVLSLPPIINSEHSKIEQGKVQDIFIECTATDLAKAHIVLDTLCTMFSEHCAKPFEIEPVEVVDAFGNSHVFPQLKTQRRRIDVGYINGYLGLDLSPERIAELLSRMALNASPSADGAAVEVEVPPTRSDVLQDVDVVEDVAIAYGYNNMPRTFPSTSTFGRELPLNQMSEALRTEMRDYTESLTWALCSRAENFTNLRRRDDGASAVSIGNPATAEFEVCRTTLLPALLKTLGHNKDAPLPLKLFEIGDVILVDETRASGCRNERRIAAVHCAPTSAFQTIHGLVNRILEVLGVPISGPAAAFLPQQKAIGISYEWQESESPTFFPGRHADVFANGWRVGEFGSIHPEVLQAFDIEAPVSALELAIEPFCFDQLNKPLRTQVW